MNQSKPFHPAIKGFFYSRIFQQALMIIGVLLLAENYLENQPLWLDEALVSIQIAFLSFKAMFKAMLASGNFPLSPPAFLFFEKIAVILFGNDEWALRIFPLALSVTNLFLFDRFLRNFSLPQAHPFGLILFVFCPALIYYSAEVKPYAGDVMVAMALLLMAEDISRNGLSLRKALLVGIGSIVGLYLSFASVFVFVGVLATLFFKCLFQRNFVAIKRILIIFFIWIIGLMVLYDVFLQSAFQRRSLYGYWLNAFTPWSQGIKSSLYWFGERMSFGLLKELLGVPFVGVGFFVLLCGGVGIYQRSKEKFFLLVGPGILALAAAALHKYPFSGRLILFLVPSLIVFLVEGVLFVVNKVGRKNDLVKAVLFLLLVCAPIVKSAEGLWSLGSKDDVRSQVAYLRNNFLPGDVLILNLSSKYPFTYYVKANRLSFPFSKIFLTDDKLDAMADHVYLGCCRVSFLQVERGYYLNHVCEEESDIYMSGAAGPFPKSERVWILLSHMKLDAKEHFVNFLSKYGRKIQWHETNGASLYLYDLR